MLRPERMSRVSVTGSKRVMDDVIETVHGLELLHVTEYDGAWEGFEPGDPIEGADGAAEKLVTVRALQSTLGVDEEDAGERQLVDEDSLEAELETVRQDVNELDDRREAVRDELRSVEDRLETMEPFVELGIEIDLLGGYDTLSVAVGEGDPDAVRDELAESDVEDYETFVEDDVVAVFARADEDELQDVLVGTPFTELAIPDGEGDPRSHRADLEERRSDLESDLDDVEDRLADKRREVAGFLLAAEEKLAIDVQKREAPLSFATSANAFVAEGWIPTDRYDDFVDALTTAVDAVDVEELERAEYDDEGHHEATEPIPEADAPVTTDPEAEESAGPTADDEGEQRETAADGGYVAIGDDRPPVVQDNPGPVKPFEALVEIINRPNYGELDPTVVLFLTFPVFFGFMIGDLGYGLLYVGIGYWLMKSFDGDVMRALGGVGLLSGAFTAVFGVLYGEIFGLHVLGEVVWGTSEGPGVVGQLFGMHGPPIHKGLQPHYIYYAYGWLLLSVVVGVVHMVIGRAFDFVNNLEHGVTEAFMESGSWIVLTIGIWWWVFTRTATGPKPDFLFSVFAREGATHPITGQAIEHVALPLGFTGFPVIELFRFQVPGAGFTMVVGLALATLFVGLGLVVAAEGGIGLIESITQGFGHVVSYTRLAAVLLAKAGMALVVNLLVFGATLHDGEFHFIFFMEGAPNPEYVVFAGLVNGEGAVALILGWIAGLALLVVGHLLVLVLGITSAGLQAVRLEYVEFFGKFYEGGGDTYSPFGYQRSFTAQE